MPKMNRRGFAPVGIVLVIVVVLGIGGFGAYQMIQGSPKVVSRKALAKMESLQYVHSEFELDTESDQGMEGNTDEVIGARSRKIHLDVKQQGVTIGLDGIILNNEEVYVTLPQLRGTWILVKGGDLASQNMNMIKQIDIVSIVVGMLKAVKEETLVKLADETVDGAKTYRLTANVGYEKFAQYMKEKGITLFENDESKNEDAIMDIWVDKKTARIVKVQMKDKDDEKDAMIVTFSKFDEETKVEKPTGQIIESDKLGQ
jgi:outer membrane lipoprotein-sorting protein